MLPRRIWLFLFCQVPLSCPPTTLPSLFLPSATFPVTPPLSLFLSLPPSLSQFFRSLPSPMPLPLIYPAVSLLSGHAGSSQAIGRSVASVTLCASVCLRCKRKTACAIHIKLCKRILNGSGSACIDPEVKRSQVKVTRLR